MIEFDSLTAAAQSACHAVGITYSEVPHNGQFNPVTVDGKTHSDAGRIKYFSDGEGGIAHNWTTGQQQVFFSRADNSLSQSELAERKKRIEAERAAADRELKERQERAAKIAQKVLDVSGSDCTENPYLVRKGVKQTITMREITVEELAKIISYHPQARGKKLAGKVLVLPIISIDGTLTGLEFVDGSGTKAALSGSVKKGCFWSERPLPDGPGKGLHFLLGEGPATVLSCTAALPGTRGIAALSAGNLALAAKALLDRYPDARLTILADAGNGHADAVEAGRQTGCTVLTPVFSHESEGLTDFNDLFQEAGIDEVRRQLTTETAPQEQRGAWPPCIDMVKLSQERPYPPRFIIPGWLPAGYATLFAGHGGIGKSGLALLIAVCIALGLSFCGLPIQRKTVLYLSCEDREGVLHWRLLRICEYLGVSMADLNGWLHVVDLVGHEVILYNGATSGGPLTPAYDELHDLMSKQGAEVLFVDGIGDTYSGNENSRAEVKAFVNALLALIPPDDGAVVLVGHVAKLSANTRTAEGYSGSTAWHNSVRARWYLYPESNVFDGRAEKTGDLLLELQKSNLGAADLSLRFGWEDAAGLFVNKESAPGQGQDQAADEQAELDGILAALRACPTYVPAARQGSHTAYHVLSVCPEFPPSLLQGTAGKKRFWRRIEQLARIRAIEESSIRRSDRKLTRVLVSTGAVCANSTIQLNSPCDNSQHRQVRELHNSQWGYKGVNDAHYPTNPYQIETEKIVPFVDVDLAPPNNSFPAEGGNNDLHSCCPF